MEILYVLIPVSLLAALGIGWAFVWAFRANQFEDLEGPAWRVVMDDDGIPAPPGDGAVGTSQADLTPKPAVQR